jgi:hypothetical protein
VLLLLLSAVNSMRKVKRVTGEVVGEICFDRVENRERYGELGCRGVRERVCKRGRALSNTSVLEIQRHCHCCCFVKTRAASWIRCCKACAGENG